MKQEYSGLWDCIHCGYENFVSLNYSVKVSKGLGVIPVPWTICMKCNRTTDLEVKEINGTNLIIKAAQSYKNDIYEF